MLSRIAFFTALVCLFLPSIPAVRAQERTAAREDDSRANAWDDRTYDDDDSRDRRNDYFDRSEAPQRRESSGRHRDVQRTAYEDRSDPPVRQRMHDASGDELEARDREPSDGEYAETGLSERSSSAAIAESADALAEAPADVETDDRYAVGSDLTFKASWNHGFEVETANKDFRIHIGGRTQFDSVWIADSPAGLAGAGGVGDQDSVGFRRARLRVDGTFYDVYDFAAEYDFVNSVNDNVGLQPADERLGNVIHVTAPTDLWWTIRELPVVGNFRIGNFKEPIGFEHLTSSRYLDFLERAYLQDAFAGPFNNGFSPGMMVYNTFGHESGTWAVGLFKNVNNVFEFGVGDGEYAVTARGTWLPWYDEPTNGRYLMHVGIAGSHRDLDDGRIRFRSRASLRNGPGISNPLLADTGFYNGDYQNLLAGEWALQLGSLLFQAEYIASGVNDSVVANRNVGTSFFHGYYVESLYFLTGEHKIYERKTGAFARVIPNTNAHWVRSSNGNVWMPGAWQIGCRYSKLDLRDAGIDGGVIQDVTLGLNWFLNPNMKLQWNYVFTHRDAPGAPDGGDIHGFGMRLAHDF